MKNIAITTSSFAEFDPSPLEACKKEGYQVVMNPHGRKVSTDELLDIAKDAVGIVAGTEKITDEALEQLSTLKVISRCGVGLDNVDIKAAEKRRIKVFTTPGVPSQAVAELTLGLILDLLRRITEQHIEIGEGQWSKKIGALLWRKRVALIGLGQIGHKVARILNAFECEIAYTDPHVKNKEYAQKELPELLSWADIVSVHVSNAGQIIGEQELKRMKPQALLVNTSRGSVINEKALYKYLKNNKIAGAALDVFEEEPYDGVLKDLPNVVLTPHIGSYAKETRIEMERQAVENLLKGLK